MGPVVHIKKEQFRINPGTKVIKAKDYLDYQTGMEFISQAKKEAETILARADAVYEQKKQQGYEDGLMEGRRKITEQLMDIVSGSLDYFESIEEKMVSIITRSTRKIIGELDDGQMIVKIVKNALKVAKNQKQVTVRVAPDQAQTVQDHLEEILAGFPATGFIDVAADSRIKPNGCIVESDIGVVDASLDVQLAAIEKSLMKRFKKTKA